jgi:CubicO group peptidase (beta-lactamase class C family)
MMPYSLQTGDAAGAVVVVVKDGQVLLQKGYGYAGRRGEKHRSIRSARYSVLARSPSS